ncbi:MAG: EipB family protein, partial [Candidatus Phaeomarinobacter sp.]
MLKRHLSAAVAATVTAVFFFLPAANAAASSLAPHRAVYSMKMLGSAEGSDISSVSGRLVIEWQGSSCDGFVTSQRIVNRMGSKQGSSFVSDFRVNSWESGDGNDFNFSMSHFMNGTSIEEIEGTAQRENSGGVATLSKPEKGAIKLPASIVFPTEQVKALMASAMAGRKVHSAPVFDGSDTEHYFETT